MHLFTTLLLQQENITQIMPATHVTAFVVLILLLLFLGGLAAGSEVAFFTLNSKDINYLKTKEQPGSRQVVSLLENPDGLMATLRATKYSMVVATVIVSNYMAHLLIPHKQPGVWYYVLLLVCIAFLLLLFVEILPKVYARQNNLRLSLFAAPVIKVFYSLFRPFAGMLSESQEYRDKRERRVLEEMDGTELQEAIELSIGHPASKEEVDIFRGIMRFGDITVKQIMQPRLEINAIRENWNITKVRQKMLAGGYSRLPMYRDNIDNIIGMIYTKDFLPYTDMDDFDWHILMRPAFYVHEHKPIEDLFKEFQERRQHFAIVVDEFGGTSGIITLEDVMEEIMGDIRDEFDEEEHNYKKIDDKNFIIEGKMLINDMCKVTGIPHGTFDSVKGQSDSIAGLILEIAGKFPTVNERINYRNIDFIVLSLDKLRIGKVKVEID